MKTIYANGKVKIIYLILLVGLFGCYGTVFSQTLKELEKKLKTGSPAWQLQNPLSNTSEILTFCTENRITYSTMSFADGKIETIQGSYQITPSELTLVFDVKSDVKYVFNISWATPDKFILTKGGSQLIYAKSCFPDDHFMQNMLNRNNGSYNPNVNSTGNSNASVTCYTCLGTGSCKVCGGTGIYSMYGYSSTCSACSGTGKCWHCFGSRKQ